MSGARATSARTQAARARAARRGAQHTLTSHRVGHDSCEVCGRRTVGTRLGIESSHKHARARFMLRRPPLLLLRATHLTAARRAASVAWGRALISTAAGAKQQPAARGSMADTKEDVAAAVEAPEGGAADGAAPALGADGQPLSKSALKKAAKLKELEAKKAATAAAAEARAKAAPATPAGEEGAASKKASGGRGLLWQPAARRGCTGRIRDPPAAPAGAAGDARTTTRCSDLPPHPRCAARPATLAHTRARRRRRRLSRSSSTSTRRRPATRRVR